MNVYETLDLYSPDTVVGRHGVWLPKQQIKVPFQWGGKIQKYQHPHEATYPLALIGEEVTIMRALASEGMAPPVGQWVFFKTVISDHLGGWWADPCGAVGYEMADAHTLPPGKFSLERMQASGLISGSPGAWNDLRKPGNVINGYLIDIRRSGWDRLRWDGTAARVPTYSEDLLLLKCDLQKEGQFPFREREQPYQEYFLNDRWWPGEREVVKRAALLGFQVSPGETVLDVGTCLGSFLHRAWQRAYGHGRFIGIDTQPEYIDLARRLARANGMNLCFRQWADVFQYPEALANWLWSLRITRLDHLLLLSMLKHVPQGEAGLWGLVDRLHAGRTYLETNAVKEGVELPLLFEVGARGGQLMGYSRDRNTRACYQVPG